MSNKPNISRAQGVFLAALVSGCAASTVALAHGARPTARPASTTNVRLARTDLGKILVDGSGSTLFMFTRDGRNTDRCVKTSGCIAVWPLLKAHGKPTAGSGLKASRLSTIKLSSGARQVVYAGHPLYTYSFASGPGDTSYVGVKQFGGHWYALDAAGHAVK